jgi:PhnB protein
MFVPYIHFSGNCAEAIPLYEKAFNTKADKNSFDYSPDGTKIAHAVMKIHGTEVALNDGLELFGGITQHFGIYFDTPEELLACYAILKSNDDNPFYETPYSKLCGNFKDKFGITWGFMVV